jgi:predicted Zn-dependent protease
MISTILSRRTALGVLCAGGLIAACSENPTTGRAQLVLVSDEMLAAMAAASWQEALATMPRADGAAQATLERVGAQVVDAAGRAGEPWEFVVFDRPEVNAFVLPGGKVGFFKGLMDFADDEAEIAAVMGHEIGHVQARHAAERMSQTMLVQLGVGAAQIALADNLGEYADEAAAALGAGVLYGVILPYSRRHELEADALSVSLMAGAGFDPAAVLDFWERMVARNADRAQPMEWMSTHPADGRRLEELRLAIARETGRS